MKGFKSISILIIFVITSCAFLQEIYEPKDLLQTVQAQKDYQAPTVSVTSPTNAQEVGSTYQITGTAVDNGGKSVLAGIDKVYISIDGGDIISCTVYNGGWQTVFSNCTEGWHTNAFYVTDKLGNTSATNRFVVFVQTSIPSLTITTPQNNILTNEQTMYMEGSVQIGLPYLIKKVFVIKQNTGTELRTSYMSEDNSWNIYLSLAEGTNNFSIRAIATSGKTNTLYWKIVLDKRAPTVTVSSPANGAEVGSLYTLSGTIVDNLSGVAIVWVQIDTNAVKTLTLSNGAFLTNITLPPDYGTHANRIIVRDVAHNTATNIVLVERKAIPTVTCVYPNGYAFISSAISLSGKAFIDAPYTIESVKLRLNNKTLTMMDEIINSNWSFATSITNLSNNFTFIVYANNTKQTTVSNYILYYDPTMPTIAISGLPTYTNVATIMMRGTASDNLRVSAVYVKLLGGSYEAAAGTTNWSSGLSLSAGLNTIYAFCVDSGEISSITNTRTITLDTIAPSLSVNCPNITNKTSVKLMGTAGDARGIKAVYVKVNTGSWTLASGTTSWSNTMNLSAGANTIAVYTVDNAGNASTNSRSITVETGTPVTSINTCPNYTNVTTVTVTGTASDANGIVAVYVKFGAGSYILATGTTNWSCSGTIAGTTLFYVYAVDNAGNSSSENVHSFTLDTTKPVLSITMPSGNITIYSNTFRVTGTASDVGGSGVREVFFKLNSGTWKKLSGTVSWSSNITLTEGANIISVYAGDNAGNVGSTSTSEIDYNTSVIVTFNSAGGSAVGPTNVVYNTIVNAPTMPTRSGYGFCGWFVNTNSAVTWNFATNTANNDITLTAKWLANADYTDLGSTIMIKHYSGNAYNVILPETVNGKPVVSIGTNVFSGKSTITNIVLPSGLTTISNYAFYNCAGLTNIVLPSGVTSIGQYAFYNCNALTNIVLPSGVTTIGQSAFSYCVGLKNIVLPSGLTSIPNNAFYSCSGLKNIVLPSGLTSIPNNAFDGCSGLTNIVLPSGVTNIGQSAFSYCVGLKNIVLPSGLTSIPNNAFQYCRGLKNIVLPSGVTSIGQSAFDNCRGLTNILLPSGLKSIGQTVFYYCTNLKNIVLPSGLTSIGDYAFNYCINLTNIVLSSGLTSIPNNAFIYCSVLKNVVLPSGLTSIGQYAFYGCARLTNIVLPNSLTSIGNDAFTNCIRLSNMTVQATNPPAISAYTLPGKSVLKHIYVPAGSTNAYKMASGWSSYEGVITAIP